MRRNLAAWRTLPLAKPRGVQDERRRTTAAAGLGNPPAGGGKLYSASGEPLREQRKARDQRDQLAAFVQDQPVTAALIALIGGYFLGKIT